MVPLEALPPIERSPRRLDDRRLSELEAVLRVPGVSVLSLDCFDTLLWRRVPKPADAFFLVGEELIARGALASGISAATFARLRIGAEVLARQEKQRQFGRPEVNLGEIYAQFDDSLSHVPADELRSIELAVERRITVADQLLAETLSRLAAELDLRVVFVSDMYLTAGEIGWLLDRPEMADLAGAEVISSADEGITKETGLWQLLPERWGVAPADIVHVGNNPVADVLAPRHAGVRAVYWAELPPRLAPIVAAEACHTAHEAKVRLASADDRGLTALRGRAAFSTASLKHDDEVAWETGTSVLGPVMAGYVEWVHQRTAELGITRALCIMREGRLLKELLEDVAPSRRNPMLECELLWASRIAIVRANIAKADVSEMANVFTRLRVPSVTEAARTLGIELSDVPGGEKLAERAAQHAGDRKALERFLVTVMCEPSLVATIRDKAARRRANFVRHLRDALGGVRGDVAYVDVGFSGSNQEKLQAIIDEEGLGVRLHGLYLMADPCPQDRLLRGHRIEGFISSPGDPLTGEMVALDRNRLLLEMLLISEDRSTVEIDDHGQPVFMHQPEPERQLAQRRVVHDGIRAYQRHLNAYRTAGASADLATVDRRVGHRIIERFLIEPTVEEARAFGAWVAEDDYNSLEACPLVPQEDRLLQRLTGPQLAEIPSERLLWPAAADVLFKDPDAAALRCELSPAGAMRVQLHWGAGETSVTMVPLRLGRDGVTFGIFGAEGSGLSAVTVYPTLTDGLLRLDSLKLLLISKSSGWRSVVWQWKAGDDLEALPTAKCSWVAQDILNVDSEAALIMPLASPLAAGAFVQIELQGGFLPGVDTAPRIERQARAITVTCKPA